MARIPPHKSKYYPALARMVLAYRFITIKSFSIVIKKDEKYTRDILARFVKNGFLKFKLSPFIGSNIYVPTKTLKDFILYSGLADTENMNTRMSKIKPLILAHDYLLQLAVSENHDINNYYGMDNFAEKPPKTPDLVFEENGHRVAIELENVVKNNLPLYLFYINHIFAVRKKFWSKVIVYTATNQAFNAHKKMFSLDKLPRVKRNDLSKLILDTSAEPLPFGDKLKGLFELKKFKNKFF